MENKMLNVLGCYPCLLNILFELAEESHGIKKFQVLKNVPVESLDHLTMLKGWEVDFFNCYESEMEFDPNELYAFSIVATNTKKKVFDYFKKRIKMDNKQFINFIHPTSYVSKSVKLNYGLQVEPLTVIAACTSIGFAVNIKRGCSIGHHCEIGDYVTIAPGVTLSGFVKIKSNTMIGSGVTIKGDITIGSNTVIGAGSVVVKDIPDNCIAFGNPCVVHKYI